MSSRLGSLPARACATALAALSLGLITAGIAAANPHIWMVPGGTPMKGWYPEAFVLDASKTGEEPRLLVFDRKTHQLLRIHLDGTKSVVAGNGKQCGSWSGSADWDNCGDGGLASQARFGHVSAIAVGRGGQLFVLEVGDGRHWLGSSRIRVISDELDPSSGRRVSIIRTVIDRRHHLAVKDGEAILIKPTAMTITAKGELLVAGRQHQPGESFDWQGEEVPEEDLPSSDGEEPDEDVASSNRVWRLLMTDGKLSAEQLAGGGSRAAGMLAEPATDIKLGEVRHLSATGDGGFLLTSFEHDHQSFEAVLQAVPTGSSLQLRRPLIERDGTDPYATWILSTTPAPGNCILISTTCEILKLESGEVTPQCVAGVRGRHHGYNGNARCANTAWLSHPNSIQHAPGGGFFFLDNERLRFIGPDDQLEAELVELVTRATQGIKERDLDKVEEVIAQLGKRAKLPTWKSAHDLHFGFPNEEMLTYLSSERGLPRDVVKYLRTFVEYNDNLEWMQSLRARMALQTINDRLLEVSNKENAARIKAIKSRKYKERKAAEAMRRQQRAEARARAREEEENWFAEQDPFADNVGQDGPGLV